MSRHRRIQHCPGAHSARRQPHRRLQHRSASPGQRAQIVARLVAASRALPAQPDAAALLLDGALSAMLDHWSHSALPNRAHGAAALAALDEHAPGIAWRLRLALQAPNPEARLAHCWALLDLLTRPSTTRLHSQHATAHPAHTLHIHQPRLRKDNQSHVS